MEVRGGRLKKGFRGRGARFFGQYFCYKKYCKKSAFTLIELMVVIAISAIVSVGGFLILYKYSASQNLKLATGEITAVLRNTQEMSVTQKNGKQWAVRFSNSTSSGQIFRTWSGLSFASSTADQTYKLRTGVNFGNPATGKDIDVIFSPITGELSQNQIITLLAGSAGSTVSDIIVNPFGKVTTRKEEGLVGYWHFDEGTSTIAYDNSGYGNNGTLYNTPMWQLGTNCKAGGCLSFNGTNNYLDGGTRDIWKFGTGNFSIGMWVYPTSFNSEAGLYDALILNGAGGRADAFVMVQNATTGKLRLFTNGAYMSASTGNLILNTWNHVGLVRSGTTATFYINGVADVTTVTLSTNITSGGAILGRYSDVANGFFAGSIDEVRIYNRALSATEILQMYNDIR